MVRKKFQPDRRLLDLSDVPPACVSYCSHLRRRQVSTRTRETYADCLKTFILWLRSHAISDPAKASPADVDEFQVWLSSEHRSRGRKLSVGRQATYAAVVREFYRYLANEMMVLASPAAQMRVPRVPKRLHRDVLTASELKALLSSPDGTTRGIRDGAAIRLLAFTGARTQEVVGVDVDDVALEDREVVIRRGKGERQRLTFIDAGTQDHLAKYLVHSRPRLAPHSERAFLVGNRGTRATPWMLNDVIDGHRRAAGITKKITCMSLRRTFCTLLLSGGANLKVIAELAGHVSLKTTTRYTRVSLGDLTSIYHMAHPRSRRHS